MNILDNVTESQKEAITHIDGPLLVIAGAGSGKTRVITRRVGYLVEKGIDPANILSITFTNKAANEMKERLGEFLNLRGMWISTFHAMCSRILRSEIEHLKFTRNFSIYDSGDQAKCIKDIMKELNLDTTHWRPSAVAASISNAKNELLSADEFAEYKSGYYNDVVSKIYTRYQQYLEANNALDFDDLLFKVVHLFKNFPEVLEKYQEKFKYILIDEYQDTNHAQYAITQLLAQRYENICATGDPDQSIYGWRGANIRNILNFEKDYPETKTVRLEQNYRSTKNILLVASEIINNNISRKPKSLWTENSEGNKVRIIHCEDENVEAKEIAANISEFVRNGNTHSDIAVFYRTNAQSRVLETCMLREGIPYSIVGNVAFFKRKEIKDLLSYLKLCANPEDDLSFERIINVPARGIGATTIKRLREWAALNNANILEAISRVQEIKEIKGKSSKAVKDFQDIISGLHKIPTYPVMGFVKQVIEKIGYADYLVLSYEADSEERLENIEELVNAASEYDTKSPDGSLQGFLEEVSLIADIDKWDDAADTVTLMTLHAAKGLEFPVVFIAGLEEGLLPHSQSKDSDDDVEEERRLCYVGITRAQRDLFLVHTRYRAKYGQRSACIPSRFLSEIPVDFVEEIDKTIYNSYVDKLHTEFTAGYRESAEEVDYQYDELPVFQLDEPQESVELVSGDIVKHAIFGRGRVVKIAPSSDTVYVDFNNVGMKKLALEYANLEKVEGSCR
ncbi:MAG: UvrD-helicase domain-containing protein [Candidatus Scalindua rubra]|uniref:DNA 3'-5' helicase n=1 Tax=Candidatus Scalindua brodae TaxID=237368 RepID=A0A0B0ERG5_9BACT|nr:MAG: ATP-dependent DNA helicase PcrA [Candidatus Scalindua brodae]MBZ0107061.1 UvrD-helicase domain-containing protein [Candidatus Scalindua rubra]